MKSFSLLLLGCLFAAASTAGAQSLRIRGTITGLDGDVLLVKTREGRDMKIDLTDKTTVATMRALKLADIKPGTGLGVTAIPGPDGKLLARGLLVFPAAAPNEGHRPHDLEAGSSMTNAPVSGIAQVGNGRELTVSYKGGTQTVIVTDSTPIVAAVEADRTALKTGEYAYIAAGMNNDGKVVATRVQVSKDGVRPPQ
ncbi:MAG: DUF5666 domain-containing protein [Burkholderiales bacterium]